MFKNNENRGIPSNIKNNKKQKPQHILRLPRSLVPAATVSFVAFAAFTHAFHCIQGGAVSETFYWSSWGTTCLTRLV